jgi:hypothetical protein
MLGGLAMTVLIKDSHLPDSATTWYGALLFGLGLDTLTNSDLITRIRPAPTTLAQLSTLALTPFAASTSRSEGKTQGDE